MKTSLSHGTEAGLKFAFVEYMEIAVSARMGLRDWLRSLGPERDKNKRTALRDRWLYAFRFDAGRARPTLAWEAFVDSHGLYSVTAGAERLTKEPAEHHRQTPREDHVELHITSNGAPTYWMFVASRIALACASLRELCRFELESPDAAGRVFASFRGAVLPVVDAALETAQFKVTGNVNPALPVVDFMTLGDGLRRVYEIALNEYQALIVPKSAGEKEGVYRDAITYTLAKVVKHLVEQDRSLAEKVHFLRVQTCIDQYEKTLADRITARDRSAQRLDVYHRSPAMILVESWYRRREEAVYDRWLDYLARVYVRLDESLPGLASLNNPSPIAEHALANYAFPVVNNSVASAKTKASVFKKSAAPITAIWSKFLPWYLIPSYLEQARRGAAAATIDVKKVARWINEVLGDEVLKFAAPPDWIRVGQHERALSPNDLFDRRANQLMIEDSRLRKAEARAKWESPTRLPAELATFLQLGIDTVNNGFKLQAFIEKPSSKRDYGDYGDAAGALNSLMKGLVWDRMAKSTAKGVALTGRALVMAAGVIGIACDLVVGYRDFTKAAKDDDLASAAFTGISTLGAVGASVVTFIGVVNPLVGMTLIAVQAAASIAALQWRDSDLANFLQHSTFGTQFGESHASPSWADGSYADWTQGAKGVERQIATMYNLVTTFRLKAYNPVTLDIHLGYYDENMMVQIDYYDDRRKEASLRLQFDPTGLRRLNVWPPHCDLRVLQGRERPTAFRVIFDVNWRHTEYIRSCCRVLLKRSESIVSQGSEIIIPHKKTKLDERELQRFEPPFDLGHPDQGLAFAISGVGNLLNLDEKSSAD